MIELKLTDEQARICSEACEFYARVLMGQFQEIPRLCPGTQLLCNHKEIQDAWLNLRSYIYHDLGGPGHSYGIGKFPQADAAYDITQVIRYAMGGKEPFSYNELPECKKVIYCKDCRHSVQDLPCDPMECMKWSGRSHIAYTTPDGHCHKAEPKDRR